MEFFPFKVAAVFFSFLFYSAQFVRISLPSLFRCCYASQNTSRVRQSCIRINERWNGSFEKIFSKWSHIFLVDLLLFAIFFTMHLVKCFLYYSFVCSLVRLFNRPLAHSFTSRSTFFHSHHPSVFMAIPFFVVMQPFSFVAIRFQLLFYSISFFNSPLLS